MNQELANSLWHYDEETGKLYWKEHGPGRPIHLKAGCIDRLGYLILRSKYKLYKVHRIIWLMKTGEFPKHQIDHIDGDRSNNVFSNLRSVTNQENMQNQSIPSNNTSGVLGVSFYKQGNKWHAHIRINRKTKHLGYFNTIEEAAKARSEANIKYNFHKNHGRAF